MGRRSFLFTLPGLALLVRCGRRRAPALPAFTHGIGIQDFGRGTLAILHGREAVMTKDQFQALLKEARAR